MLKPALALLALTSGVARHVAAAESVPDVLPISAAVFTADPSGDAAASFVFALNVDQQTGDLYLHMSAPAGNEWMGVGIGSDMKGAGMFIAYPSKNGTGMTLSTRVGYGHTEPSGQLGTCELSYADDLTDANTVSAGTNGTMTVDAVCHNATTWSGGSLPYADTTAKTAQPFIFAVGPSTNGHGSGHGPSPLRSNSLSAGLRRHVYYGHFTMDITNAVAANTSLAGIPLPNSDTTYTSTHSSAAIDAQADNDPAPAIHAFVMCLTFVIIFPLGALLLKLLHRVRLHAIVQTVGLVLVTMATAGGIVISTQYNRSRHFASAHQVLGILLFLALLGQLGLGIVHHRIFKKEQRPTLLGKIHRYLGPVAIAVGVINAPIGFVFAGNPHLCLPYVIVLVIVAVVFFGVRFCVQRRAARRPKVVGGMPGGGPAEGYQYPQFGSGGGGGNGGGNGNLGPPPAYGRSESYGSEDVPLRPYESQSSGLGEAQHPRTIV
ncbi:hypothetical protein LTR08_002769 [Meristemomyces frigidus]|nr:hypothetical protein LTR08_002769 [Meristemomyces frigidus]